MYFCPRFYFILIFNWHTMFIQALKSKIHRATVTQADLNYVGSITIDEILMETYVIRGERGSGMICLNGAAARKVAVGDIIIIMSYAYMTEEEAKQYKPRLVFPNSKNALP